MRVRLTSMAVALLATCLIGDEAFAQAQVGIITGDPGVVGPSDYSAQGRARVEFAGSGKTAAAYADMATGTMGVKFASTSFSAPTATAILTEQITFFNPGAAPNARSSVSFVLGLDGDLGNGNLLHRSFIERDYPYAVSRGGLDTNPANLQINAGPLNGNSQTSKACATIGSLSNFTAVCTVEIFGASDILNFRQSLGVTGLVGAGPQSSDFFNTSTVQILTASGVTWASRSGRFLSASSSAVPETSTWAMMIAGFGVIGWVVRRSRQRDLRAIPPLGRDPAFLA